MVIFGGLEVVAAGYLIHKHQQNKKDKKRLEEEAAALEEQEYRIFPNDRRHHRSHSRDRHGHRRRHSADGKYRREDSRPAMGGAATAPVAARPQQFQPQPVAARPPPPYVAPMPPQVVQQAPPPQGVKYGWTDEQPVGQRPNGQFPPTGWPAHWEQSQSSTANSGARLQPPREEGRRDRERGGVRDGQRAASAQPTVRFASSVRSVSRSPPPSYRSGSRR